MLGLIAAAAAAGASIPIVTAAVDPTQYRLPDLRSDPPGEPSPVEVYSNTALPTPVDDWLIVRFDGYITNVGAGPLDVAGNPQLDDPAPPADPTAPAPDDPAAMWQRAPDLNGVLRPVAKVPVKFENTDDHNHFHLKRAVEYSLWTADKRAMVAPANKVGFCLYDIEDLQAVNGRPERTPFYDYDVTRFCQAGNRGATQLRMGVSAGWRDIYDRDLEFQYVNVSNVAPGTYLLASRADPDDVIAESDEDNPIAFADATPVTVPGFVASPVQAGFDLGAPATVRLRAETVGSGPLVAPANRRFRIVEAPAHGTLDRPVGASFAGDTVTYTPDPGFRGVDTFRYVAVNTFGAQDDRGRYPNGDTSQAPTAPIPSYPLSPPQATGLVVSNGGAVGISGAPALLFTGTAAQLTADVYNVAPGVAWSVDGVPGGNAAVGTIGADGLYTAPAAAAPGTTVTITATSLGDPSLSDSVTIEIVPAPEAVPLPAAPPSGTASIQSVGVLGTPTTVLKGAGKRILIVGVTSRRSGQIAINARDGARSSRTCRVRVAAGQRATCRIVLKKGMRAARTTVITVLRPDRGARVVKRTRLRAR